MQSELLSVKINFPGKLSASLAKFLVLVFNTVQESLQMPFRYRCPHCHTTHDPSTLETGVCASADLRICPVCDSPIVAAVRVPIAAAEIPAVVTVDGLSDPIPV